MRLMLCVAKSWLYMVGYPWDGYETYFEEVDDAED